MIKYAILIINMAKFATYSIKETVFKPIEGNAYSMGMYVKNDSVGHEVQFGVLNIEQDFVDFLSSGDFDNRVGGLDSIVAYIKNGSLTLSDEDGNREALSIVNNNFDKAKSGNESDVLELASSKRDSASLGTAFRRKELNIPMHDAALQFFNYWLQKNKKKAI